MSDSGDNDGLSDKDRQIWRQYIDEENPDKNIQATQDENFEALLDEYDENGQEDNKGKAVQLQAKLEARPVQPEKQDSRQGNSQEAYQLDKRTAEKLKKGKMHIDARLDLHGLNRTQAHENLNGFLQACYQKNLRCVLVITGKGKSQSRSEDWLTPSKGILKEHVPLWLGEGYLRKIVLKYVPAQPKDGGSGALYVYLKNNR